jgi:hypothetical protein
MSLQKQKDSKLGPSESVKIHLHYLDHFFRIEQNEELQSEQRIKFFLSLATGSIAIFSVLNKPSLQDDNSLKAFSALLFFLFLIGLFVFARVIWSDRKIKQHRELWTVSYDVIKAVDPSIARYRKRMDEMDDQNKFLTFRIFKGTLTQIIWFTEGVLIALFMFVLGTIQQCQPSCRIMLSLITGAVVLLLLFFWARYIKKGITSASA